MDEAFIQKASEIIEQNLGNDDFGIQELANQLLINRTQLFRKLIKIKGQSPTTFVRHFRLEKGMKLLATSNKPIKEIAYKVGFKDPAHFSKTFKELYGISPKEIRW